MFVLFLYYSRLALDHEHYLIIFENDRMGEVDLILDSKFDLVDFLEGGNGLVVGLRNRFAGLVIYQEGRHVDVVNVGSVRHHT